MWGEIPTFAKNKKNKKGGFMKKFAIMLGLLLFCCQAVLAEEVTTNKPIQNFEDNRATVAFQKHPTTENTQKQSVKNNWFCIVLQINGKVLDSSLPMAK